MDPIDLDAADQIADAVLAAACAARDDGTVTWLTFGQAPAALIVPQDSPEAGVLVGHEHQWVLRGAQPAPPAMVFAGSGTPRTAVAGVCGSCGEPGSWLLNGTWTLNQLRSG